MRVWFVWCAIAALAACGPKTTGPDRANDDGNGDGDGIGVVRHGEDTPSEDARFQAEADAWYRLVLERDPVTAVSLGYHDYDGKLPDVTPEARTAYVDALKKYRATFESLHPSKLSREHQIERAVVLNEIDSQLFEHEVVRSPERNPMAYMWQIDLETYVGRDYAPVGQRAAAIARLCGAAGPFLAQARENLEDALPRTWIQTAQMQVGGLIEFVKKDVPAAMSGLDAGAQEAFDAGLAACVTALSAYAAFLNERLAQATDDYALGAEQFAQMLRATEALDIELTRLEAIGKADLARNLAALDAAAKKLDPRASTARVVARVAADKPPLDGVIPLAEQQSARMRQFLIDREIVSIPTDDVAEVRETPPFMRFNFAFLSGPGPFEQKRMPAYYYITPPDPSWPKKVQRDYVPFRSDLLFTTIHEVWPGHFLQGLHEKQNDSKILKSFCSYAMSEGWAHYTEEMMWDAGVGEGDPKVHIGQLTNALLRDVRFVSAVGLHTQGMTVEQSKQLFREQAFADEGNAIQQAVRGTFDPGYLNYTLGKLMIRKLHDDWKAAAADRYSLKAFHDEFLSYGCAPIPVIRRFMLGQDAGPAL